MKFTYRLFCLCVLAIVGLSLTASAGDITLAWDPVISPVLAGYELCYGAASGQYHTTVDVGNVVTFTVAGLPAGIHYFAVRAYGTAGEQSGFSNEVSTTIEQPADTAAPVISGVGNSNITVSSALISWTTNEASDSQVQYGLTASYGSSTTLNASMVTAHSQSLTGLAPGTTYHYRVLSKDAAGNTAVSADYMFITAIPSDTTAPVISGISSSGVTATSAVIFWTTNEASDSQVEYGTTASYGSTTALNTSMVTSHTQGLSGLAGATTYHYRVRSRDAAGNAAVSGDYTFTTSDTAAPVITGVSSSSVTATSAVIFWTTNEASDSQVEYGTTASYGSTTALNTSMVTSHTQSLSGLTGGNTYHYRVKSKDAAGNESVSADFTVTTTSIEGDITEGLVALYSFDEGSGTTTADSSGSGNVALLRSAEWVEGKYGKAVSFDGGGSYVSAGIAGLPDLNEPKTISFWGYGAGQSLALQSMVALANPMLRTSVKYGYKSNQVGIVGYEGKWILVGQLAAARSWHHFGYVFDGLQNRLYVDGQLVGTSTISPAAGPVSNFEIGRSGKGSEYYMGIIDEVRVYNRALSAEELNAVMNAPAEGIGDASAATMDEPSENPVATLMETPVQTLAKPTINIQLGQQSYKQGETLNANSLRIGNPANQSREVEVKTWIRLPGLQPISLDMVESDSLTLSPGFSRTYGLIPLLKIAPDSPAGNGEVNGRLIDPVTGDALALDINPFTIAGALSSRVKSQPAIQPALRVTLDRNEVDGRIQYLMANTGTLPASIEFKAWIEAPGIKPIALLSSGSDGFFVLPVGAEVTVDVLDATKSLDREYTLKARVLDPASGEIFSEK